MTKAVVPAAGLATRMRPLSKGVPKEMLPAGRKPVIQLVVEEAVSAGLTQVCVVIREGKEVLRDYFLRPVPAGEKRDASTDELEALAESCELTFVYQRERRGIGDALLCAREFVGREPFVMLVPDQLMLSDVPAARQLLSRWQPGLSVWTSLARVPREDLPLFSSSRGFEYAQDEAGGVLSVGRILSEDETAAAHRGLDHEVRGFGRTIYPPEFFEYLGAGFEDERTGEVDLGKSFAAFAGRLSHRGVMLEGRPLDLGTFEGYYRALPRLVEAGL